jgi:hypothetical protein
MKVKATNKYQELNVEDKELKRIPKAGEEFEVSGERYEILKGNNKYNAIFVEAVETVREPLEVETAKKEVKTEKAVKKTTKKAK